MLFILGEIHHEVRFQRNTADGRHRAICSCGWTTSAPNLFDCELRSSVHDLDDDRAAAAPRQPKEATMPDNRKQELGNKLEAAAGGVGSPPNWRAMADAIIEAIDAGKERYGDIKEEEPTEETEQRPF